MTSTNTPLWETGDWTPLAPISGDLNADVCVVGLGGSGLTAVHELLDAGVDVIGIDAGIVAGGAAGRNGGLALAGLAPFHHDAVRELGHERALRFYRATMDEQQRMLAATPFTANELHITLLTRLHATNCRAFDQCARAVGT